MSDILNTFIFHWEPSKAVWIGWHTLSWDARCSGIYIGFGAGVLYQIVVSRKRAGLSGAGHLALNAALMLPLFIDVFTVRYELRLPSNDIRYATGLLFGEAFSAYLYPAFMIINGRAEGRREGDDRVFNRRIIGPLLLIPAFLLIKSDNIAAFAALELAGIFGFSSLFGILTLGIFKIFTLDSSHKKT